MRLSASVIAGWRVSCCRALQENAAESQYISIVVLASTTYPVYDFLARPLVYIISENLCLRTDPHAVSNLLDTHFLQHLLVHVHEVLAVDVISPEDVHVLSAVDTSQPVTHTRFVPILYRLRGIIPI
jgi:hypothetical protein